MGAQPYPTGLRDASRRVFFATAEGSGIGANPLRETIFGFQGVWMGILGWIFGSAEACG